MSVMIIGSGLSGLAVADYLTKVEKDYFFADKKDIDASHFDEKYIEEKLKDVNLVVVSPGICLDIELINQIKKRKIKIVGEFEFGATKLKNSMIAVTGTNGKTTTVNIINHILKDSESGSVVAGNIGVPVTSLLLNKLENKIVVLEASSFQLETIKKFRPNIAVILNITPDHFNRHKTMKEYMRCKYNITKNQTQNDYLFLNADDKILMENKPKTKAQIFYFSTKNKVVGCYIKNKSIYFNDNIKEKKLATISKIRLLGDHNLSNILAAVLAVYLQTGNSKILKNISSFSGVPHRLEFVNRVNGVEFYNDSKATNIDSCLVAIKSFNKPINLILGGSDKGYDFDNLAQNLPKNVKNLAIFGETKNKIAFSLKKCNYKNFYICDNLESSIRLLFRLSSPGEIVLLSPACASFDFFSNYEERGNFFKKVVREIEKNEISFSEKEKE